MIAVLPDVLLGAGELPKSTYEDFVQVIRGRHLILTPPNITNRPTDSRYWVQNDQTIALLNIKPI